MRTPETHYFKQGCVVFRKLDGQLRYSIFSWNEDGTEHYDSKRGIVKDEEHLNQLLSIQTLGSVTEKIK